MYSWLLISSVCKFIQELALTYPVKVVEEIDEHGPSLDVDILQGHDEAAHQDEDEHHALEVRVLNEPEREWENLICLAMYSGPN